MRKPRHWNYYLYRLQQRLAITQRELRTLWVLLVFLLIGVAVKDYRQRHPSFDAAIYAESDSLFAAAISRMRDESNPADSSDRGDPAPAASSEDETAGSLEALMASGGRINLNTATQQELESLPRIGPATATRILAYRDRYGPFRRIEDLMQVRGIGEKTFERLAGRITVD